MSLGLPHRNLTLLSTFAVFLFFVSLLVALVAAGCSGGQGNVVVMFPQHDAPLGTDNGGHYFAGQLALDEGCLRAEVPEDPNTPASSWLLIWPSAFTLDTEDGALRIVDENGRIAARVGDHIRLSRATVRYQEAQDQGLIQGLSEECAGPYVLVGDEVTAFDPNNEPTELRLSDPDLIFPRQTTTIASRRQLLTAEGIGELVLEGPQSEHSAMQPTAPPSSDGEDDNRRRDFPPAPVWGPDAVYSEKDLEKAIQRVHYAIYCSQWTMDATTSADGGMILSLVAIGGPANGEVMSIEGFQSTAEHALLSGANEGISVMVEEWDGPVSTPESREKACDDYVHSRTQEELQEADLRFYARQEGLSYEEVLRRSGWHDGISREVVGRIDREYPGTYVQHAYGTADGNKRSARIGFYGEIDEGIQTILDNYSGAN